MSRRDNKRYFNGIEVTRFLQIWADMKRRCDNPNRPEYKNYGARGITYDTRWKDFASFFDDMHESYVIHAEKFTEKDTTLDRIDVNKGYTKENCKWSTMKEQQNNRRDTFFVKYKDSELTLNELHDICGIPTETLRWRYKNGMRDDALVKPLRKKSSKQSGLKNIIWSSHEKKWMVLVSIGEGKQKRLGSFKEIESAKELLEKFKRGELIV